MTTLFIMMTGCYFNKPMTDRQTDVRIDGQKIERKEIKKVGGKEFNFDITGFVYKYFYFNGLKIRQ